MILAPRRQNSRDAGRAVCGVGNAGGSDERKPRCQNCIDKNLDCYYGLQVTFLPKNSITVTAGEVQSPTVDRSANYNKIQFVNDEPLSIDNLAGLSAENTQPSSPTSTFSTTPLPLSPSRRNIRPGKENGRHSVSASVSERERGKYCNSNSKTEEYREPITYSTYRDFHSRTTLAPWELDDHNHNHSQNPNTNPVTFEHRIPPNTFSAKDEFAVRGLLALGTQSGPESSGDSIPVSAISNPLENTGICSTDAGRGIGPGTPLAANTPNRAIGGSGNGISPSLIDGILGVSTPVVHSVMNYDVGNSNSKSNSDSSSNPSSETWKMKLLQHYRYNVAPWLDIHDLTHTFGIKALQIAVNSPSGRLLPALMALSEACLQVQGGRAHTHDPGFQAVYSEDTAGVSYPEPSRDLELDVNEGFTESVLLRMFGELRSLVSDVAGAWAKNQNGDGSAGGYDYGYEYRPLQSLVHRAYGLGMESAMYWMFLRLDIGRSLANNIPLRTPLPSLPIPSLALLCRTENTLERVGHYAQVLLWLCGKALTTYHQESTPATHQAPGTDSWLQTFEELNQWHCLRPQEFQPMVELDHDSEDHSLGLNTGSEFPMLLFTNGAGALCNQIYHTAMLFMLECKPRTAVLLNQNNPHFSPMLSPLWHAQRVCGIALNNDRCECWDPCLLASFLVAARHMTHESQQVEILRGFDRIQTLTGWGVGEYLTQLREEWSFLDGVE
ncbi:hypothetical protein BDW62DRAFT_217431 [Aspergillus aurantiobrunneus]